ncbi:MAG TPA: RHS repeat-associated core domain-containing protein [Edaphocola sp.]|nr:RHS repeat-associated core domain-containing protein [Edaphocola sp.]
MKHIITTILGKEDGSSIRYYVLTDYLGSITHIMNHNGNIIEAKSYDAWGRYRSPDNWQPYDPTFADMQFYRGYTGHEYIPEFGIINMNGRLYDPLVGRMFSPDPYIMGSDNTQGYNRYTYALNNPFTYTDPSGEFVWAPLIIGAAVGAYIGGTMANQGNYNPFQWDRNSKTWGWMAGGAVVGGLSGFIGGAIASAGVPFSNTAGIVASSFVNSVGTAAYTGGQTGINVSLGAASLNLSNGEFGFLGKKGNSWSENLGYAFGALANLQDAFAGIRGVTAEYRSESEGITHARLRGEYNKSKFDISVAHEDVPSSAYKYTLVPGDPGYNGLLENLDYGRFWSTHIKKGIYYGASGRGLSLNIFNVNGKWLHTMSKRLGDGMSQGKGLWGIGKLLYGTPLFGCQSHVAHALLGVGIPTLPINFMPQILWGQLWLRQAGIYASPILINR